jgi:1-phosphofructokinase family hexose kinase
VLRASQLFSEAEEVDPVLVVTPNLCFDRTLLVDTFSAGSITRPHTVRVTPGGKGVNVARTLLDLGLRSRLLGFVADRDREHFAALVADEGLDLVAVAVPGDLRCATIVFEASARATVLNEPGPVTGPADADRLCAAVDEELARGRATVLVCSGSLPPGLPEETYGRLAEIARGHGALGVVDAARDVLARTLPFAPDLVTPNLHEAEGVLHGRADESSHDDGSVDEVRGRAGAAAAALVARGARHALVTAGAHGAAFTDGSLEVWVPAPQVTVRNPIGAGDSLVGGLVAALAIADRSPEPDWRDVVSQGVAVASAAVEVEGAGRVDARRARELASRVAAAAS